MSGNNEGHYGRKHDAQHLPHPQIPLQEKSPYADGGAHQASYNHRPETTFLSGKEGPDAHKKADERILHHLIDAPKAEDETADADNARRKNPVIQHQLGPFGPHVRTLVILTDNDGHQRNTHNGDTRPNPQAPILMQPLPQSELQQVEKGREPPPQREQVAPCRLVVHPNLAPGLGNDIQSIKVFFHTPQRYKNVRDYYCLSSKLSYL